MTSSEQIYHTLFAVLAFLIASHLGGFAFSKLKLPPVIGEIVGGLLLGPTLLGAVAPELSQQLFDSDERISVVLSMIYNFGFMLLMFCSGLSMRGFVTGGARKLAFSLALCGTVIPLGFGLLGARLIDLSAYMGPHSNQLSLALVFAVAIAVTSLPVLSRIFLDLGIMGTPFTRICLSASVLDDIILYVVLAIALSISSADAASFGLIPASVADLSIGLRVSLIALSNIAFVLICLTIGRKVFALLERFVMQWLSVKSPVAMLLAALVGVSVFCLLLGIPLVLGAFCAGLLAANSEAASEENVEFVKKFSFAFFVPIYFALVGFKLDLLKEFELSFFVLFLLAASLIKSSSIYLGAKLGGAGSPLSQNLAIVLNARGGPGIVVASVAFDAGIIDARLYTSFVLLAIVTSLLAGAYLGYRVKHQLALGGEVS